MRKAFRHTGVLMMLSVVALGLIGAAYALWYEDLTLSATVSTGTLDADLSIHDLDTTTANAANNTGLPVVGLPPAGFQGVASYLDGPNRNFENGASGYANFTNTNFPAGKPQPTCAGGLSTNSSAANNNTGSNNVLSLAMGGLFPYAGCEYSIDLSNIGSVPAHFSVTHLQFYTCTDGTYATCTPGDGANAPWSVGLDPANANQPACAAWLGYTFGKVISSSNVLLHDFNGGTGFNTPLQIKLGLTSPYQPGATLQEPANAAPLQLHQNESVVCNFKLILDQNDTAEGKFYKFEATYKAYQWNETP